MRSGNPGRQLIVADGEPVVPTLAHGDEAQIELVRVELCDQLCAVPTAQLHLNAAVARVEIRYDARERRIKRAVCRADGNRADIQPAQLRGELGAALARVQQVADGGQQLFALLCRANAAVLAQQERNARLLLKRRDHAAHAGGRVLQRLRGGGQTSGLNGADERAVAIEFHGVLLCEIVKDGLMDHRFTQSVARVYAVVKSLEMGETMARSYDLTSGSIPQHLLRLAAPLIMGNILQQLYNTVDAFILGRFAGDLEFAAVGVAGSVMNLFLFMITGACTGISVIFAQLYGADERERFRREHWRSLSCGLLVTLACSGLGFLLLSPLLRLIQTPSELKTFVSVYLTIILASLPAAFLYNLYGALLRAIGRANAALMALAAAVTVNVALDYCFVARFQLGIAGAAWATAAS